MTFLNPSPDIDRKCDSRRREEDHAEGGKRQVEWPVNFVGIWGRVKILPVLLRMVHQPGLEQQLQITSGILRHQSDRVHVQLRRNSAQVPAGPLPIVAAQLLSRIDNLSILSRTLD